MKILYHHRIRSKDGQYVHLEELVNALRHDGHEVILAGPVAVEEQEFGAEAGLVAVLKRYLPGHVYELLEFCYAFGDFLRLATAVRRHRPDGLYERYNLYLPSGVWVKRVFKLPMLLEVNAPLYEERRKYSGLSLKRLARWTERFAWRGADFVLPVTRVLAERVVDAGVSRAQIEVIHNGVDLVRLSDNLSPQEAKRKLRLDGKLVLGFIGFMREWHGLEHIVDLIADSSEPDRHLLIVGDGPARAGIQARAQQRGIEQQLTITGVVERDHVADYIAAFDIALQPAVVEYASPLKLFEYLAVGRAIVAPRQPNIEEILTDGENALLFDVQDRATLGAAMERLCVDEQLRHRLSEAARQTIFEKKLLWADNAGRVAMLFEKLMGQQA